MSFRGLIRYVLKMQETWRIIADLQGWKRSFKEGRPLDGEGRSIPWYTYPAIEFIRSLQLNESKVFEYGAGNSSVFWAGCTKKVIAVENDPAWADEIRLKNISNLTVLTMESREDYINAPTSIDEIFDIVIIDGRYRKDCANIATKIISEHGIIIFDNSD